MSKDELMPARTRFAPSPTGYLHIGSLRTVLFSWLWSKHTSGKFLLRIEDTDQKRLVADAEKQIKMALLALGLSWDEGPDVGGPHAPYTQSERLPHYHLHADELLAKGHLYKCFCTPERLKTVAEEKAARKETPGYDRHCRHLSPAAVAAKEAAGLPYVLRIKAPTEGEIVVNDLARGPVAFKHTVLQDLVMIKSDGFPTYHFAVVVDDHEMDITHVIRGDEWLPTAPIHVLLYQLLGWKEPAWVHVSPVKGPDGKKKLSKRDGDVAVTDYLKKGYIPEALINFLALVGWGSSDNREIMSVDELVEVFDLSRIVKSGGIFDIVKLNNFNGVHIRRLADDDLMKRLLPYLAEAGLMADSPSTSELELVKRLVPHLKERMVVLSDAPNMVRPFVQAPSVSAEALLVKGLQASTAKSALAAARSAFSQLNSWCAGDIEACVRALALEHAVGKPLFMVLRVAVTGSTTSLPLFETLNILGKEESLSRIDSAVAALASD